MKKKYGVDFFPNIVEGASGENFYKFFQTTATILKEESSC